MINTMNINILLLTNKFYKQLASDGVQHIQIHSTQLSTDRGKCSLQNTTKYYDMHNNTRNGMG